MSLTKATVHNGYVKVPSHWPEGTEVELKVNLVNEHEEDDQLSPTEITRLLQACEEYFNQDFDQKAYREIQKTLDENSSQDKASAFKFLDKFGHNQ